MSKRTRLLHKLKHVYSHNTKLVLDVSNDDIGLIIEGLEKQIAKKPRIIGVSDYAEYMKCPQCRLTTAVYSNMRPDYCSKCGQKLDWGEED